MRLLHIADLHAGKTLGKVSRNPDLVYALDQVAQFAQENSPDLLLVAGDVFDKANPDNESKELIFDFFLRLKHLRVGVLVVAGNHDSYDFMRSIRNISRLANVHIYDRPNRENCTYDMGDLRVACLPYPSERVITSASEDSKRTYAGLVSEFIRFLARKVENARHRILLTHLFVSGAKYTRTEKEATITQHYAVPPASLTDTFDYVALGHVHRYQRIEDAPTYAYYTGSLYQLDFSEAGDDKFFNWVILGEGPPRIEAIRLDLKNPLKVFDLKQGEVLDKLEDLKSEHGYLKIFIRVEDRTTLPLLVDSLREELGDRLIKIELITEQVRHTSDSEIHSKLDPLELYREYHRTAYGKDLPENLEKKFLELLRSVEERAVSS